MLIIEDGTHRIYCYVGSAEYYMGDEEYPEPRPLTPRLYMVEPNSVSGFTISGLTLDDEITTEYNIELISWEFSDTIENDFE